MDFWKKILQKKKRNLFRSSFTFLFLFFIRKIDFYGFAIPDLFNCRYICIFMMVTNSVIIFIPRKIVIHIIQSHFFLAIFTDHFCLPPRFLFLFHFSYEFDHITGRPLLSQSSCKTFIIRKLFPTRFIFRHITLSFLKNICYKKYGV